MIKLQDFAQMRGVTDRAIQKHIKNHEAELEGHIERRGVNGTWLDDFAQEFIANLMYRPAPTAVADVQIYQEYEDLKEKYLTLLEEVNGLRKSKELLNEIQGRLAAAETTQKLLEASNEDLRDQAAQSRQEASTAAQKANDEFKKRVQAESAISCERARNAALMNRGLWARIINRDVDI